eukprot:10568970-Lingulodinium_polyedra.AAC.1
MLGGIPHRWHIRSNRDLRSALHRMARAKNGCLSTYQSAYMKTSRRAASLRKTGPATSPPIARLTAAWRSSAT